MDHTPTERLVDQRLRNRIMEALLSLEEMDLTWGFSEYFEGFYDFVPHDADGSMHENSAVTRAERAAILEVSRLMDLACDSTPGKMTPEQFEATGWRQKIRPAAKAALALMLERGRFSEEIEEDVPSGTGGWPGAK